MEVLKTIALEYGINIVSAIAIVVIGRWVTNKGFNCSAC